MFVKLVIFLCGLAAATPQHYNGPLAGGVPASQYPAGIDPASCPNYPNCENPYVAVSQIPASPQYNAQQFTPASQYSSAPRYTSPQYSSAPLFNPASTQYNPTPQYQQYAAPQYAQPGPAPQYNPISAGQYQPAPTPQYSPDVQNALDKGEYIGDGDYHGEGLAEAGATNNAVSASPIYSQAQTYSSPVYNQYNAPAYDPSTIPQSGAAVGTPAQIPAGLDPRACPNYPFCH